MNHTTTAALLGLATGLTVGSAITAVVWWLTNLADDLTDLHEAVNLTGEPH